jgi:hypothetical protein
MQRVFFRFLLILILTLTGKSLVLAQDSIITSLDSSKVYYFYADFEKAGPEFLKPLDTLITTIQKYNPTARPGNYYASLGSIGHASASMVYKPGFKSGFDFGNTQSFEKFFFNIDSLHYHWVGTPYTHLKYVMGSKKEQNLAIDAAQNVSKLFNIGLTFRYTNSPGYYSNQKTDDKNFAFKTRFQTKNYRYVVLGAYLHNKLKLEDNGGIKYDSLFEQNIEQSRQNFEVNLNSAISGYKENTYFVKQYFFLSKRHRFRMEMEDSLNPRRKIIPGNISLSSRYSRKILLYKQDVSDNNGFYQYTFDSLRPTYDSTFISEVENQLSWTNTDNAKQQLLTFNFAIKHLYSDFKLDSTRTTISQLIPSGEVHFAVSDILRIGFSGDFVTGNAYAGDYHLKGFLSLLTRWGDLSYMLTNAMQEPDYFYRNYYSNHFRWNSNVKKETFLLNNIEYKIKNFNAGVNLYAISNFIYMDSLAMPAQMNENLNVVAIFLRKLINVGNWSFDVRGVYQNASNSALRVPELAGDISIYYTNHLFKNAAILQPGIDLFYNTSYFGYAYMPANKSFYLQNSKKTGDYIYGDIFINLQIKRAILFLKYVNLGSLLGDYAYFTVPSYPMPDDGFRFGVSWMFYD